MANLLSSPEYKNLTPEKKAKICNGCGAKSGISSWLVPNTMYGLSVLPACQIHDFDYFAGKTIEDKEKADRVFLNNMVRIIEQDGSAWLSWLRRRRAKKYYIAVRDFGGAAYWSGKN